MSTKRNKPRLAVTVDADVMAWLEEERARKRLSMAAFANMLLAEAMTKDQQSSETSLMQIHNGHGDQKAVVRKKTVGSRIH